jgi:hypothetical protein
MFIVEMCGGPPYTPGYRHFSCHGKVWGQILQLANEWGWKQLGTTPDGDWGRDHWGDAFIGDYRPGNAGKIVSAEDGRSLAEALGRAVGNSVRFPAIDGLVLIVECMTPEEYRMANAPLSVDLLEDFVHFLRKGEFSFFWDD